MRPLMPQRKGTRPKPTRLPDLLSQWMDKNRYTNHDVAKALGLSDRHGWRQVSRWKNEGQTPERDNEQALARLLGVAIEDFYPPGTFEDAAVRNETLEQLDSIAAALERLEAVVQENRQEISLLVSSLVPGLSERVQSLRERLEQQDRAEERSEAERSQRRPPGEAKGPNGA